MAAYLSQDLRIRVIRAIEGGMSRNAAAKRFGISSASAIRWMQTYLRTGRTQAKPCGGDRRSKRIEAHADFVMATLQATPDITLAELRGRLVSERGEHFAISTPPRVLSATPHHVEKKTAHASEQDRDDVAARRHAWVAQKPHLDPEKLVFIDETGVNTKMVRRHRALATRHALPGQGAARSLEHHHLGVRPSPGWLERPHGHRRCHGRRRLQRLRRVASGSQSC